MIRSRQLATAVRTSGANRRLAAEAAAALLSARLRSGLLPFRVLARQIGPIVSPGARPSDASAGLSAADEARVRAIRWSIAAVAPGMPFRTLCLQQAIAARAMLARRGIPSVLHLGVASPAGGKLAAHAWLEAGAIEVTGYPVDPALAEVGRFV